MQQKSQTELEAIWAQVPPDYYFSLNYGQKLWHEWKWLVFKHLLTTYSGNPKTILEVGCAAGHVSEALRLLYPTARVTGIDVYASAVSEAKKRYPHITFRVADAHKLPFPDHTFDLVVCSETIEHVVDPAKVISEMKRVTSKNGHILIEMDSGSLLFRGIWYVWTKFGSGKVWKNAHLHPFKASELEMVIRGQQLNIKKKLLSHFGMAVSFIASV